MGEYGLNLSLLYFGPGGWGGVLLTGAVMTLAVSVSAFLLGIVLGTAAALAKLSRHRFLRSIGIIYTTVIRGIPELLVIYLFFFGTSSLIMAIAKAAFGYAGYIEVDAFAVAVLALGLISGAYSTEVIRGGIASVPKGQMEAATALGLRRWVIWLRILLPQAMRFALPGLANVWQLTLKDTALISVTGLAEIMRTAFVAAGATREPFLFYAAAALLYLLLTWGSSRFFSKAETTANRGFAARAK